MEENKNCCENGVCIKCKSTCGAPRCGSTRSCCMVKLLALIVVLVVVFCLGSQWGKVKGLEGRRYEGKMMNWDSSRSEGKYNENKTQATDSVIVETENPTE